MEVVQKAENGVAILEISGRLDTNTTAELEEKVVKILEDGGEKLLFDMSGMDYINSSGLRVLVMAYQRLKKSGGTLAVAGIKDYILEVFEIAGYNKLFSLYPDRTAAISAM